VIVIQLTWRDIAEVNQQMQHEALHFLSQSDIWQRMADLLNERLNIVVDEPKPAVHRPSCF
jgi:hypothetical protein